MVRYVIKRILWMIPVLLGVCVIVFALTRLSPGDPVVGILGTTYTQEQYDQCRAELGLDDPVMVQLVNYIKGIVTRFDLGTSYQSKRPVTTEIMERFPVTLKLAVLSVLFSVLIGIPTGIISAVKQYSAADYVVTSTTIILSALPNFWFGMMMMLFFSLKLGWLPASGIEDWKCWIMPVIVQGISPVCVITRLTRSNMLEVIRQDYIRTARAKGLGEGIIIRRHAVKNALMPVVTMIGMQTGMVLGGSVITESIFAIPGLGSLMVSAISNLNYPTIMGCVFFLCILICMVNLVVDVAYAYIDPRIKAQYENANRKARKILATAKEG